MRFKEKRNYFHGEKDGQLMCGIRKIVIIAVLGT